MSLSLFQRLKMAARILVSGRVPALDGHGAGSGLANRRLEIPSITADEIAEVRTFFPMDKFFVFGHARSGTTLLARLLRVHPEVHCNYQAHFFTRPPLLRSLVADSEVGAWLSRRSNRWNHGRDLSPLVLRAVSDFIMEREARPSGKHIVGDKSPNSLMNGQAVRLLHQVYPDGRLIYIIRDGRDTVLSHRFQSFVENPDALPVEDQAIRQAFVQYPGPFLKGELSIFTEKGLRQAAQGWVNNVVDTDAVARELFGAAAEGGAYYAVRYEDLLQQPAIEMEKIWTFLGVNPASFTPELEMAVQAERLQNPDADWQQQKANEIATSLQKGREGSWKEMFTPEDRQAFNAVAGDTLQTWDYELE